MLNDPRNDFASAVRELATTTASRMSSPAKNQTLPAKIRNAYRVRCDRVAKLAVVLLHHYRLFPVQFGEGFAFLGQTRQQLGRFPEFALLLMKF